KSAFDNLNPLIKFTYVKTEHCSLSHARNLGLPLVEGEYVCFPDDDCWYEPDTLKKALEILQDGVYQIISGMGTNEKGIPTSIFPQNSSEITSEKRCAAISYTMFFKYMGTVFFDENMGVGSPYNLGAGEETDYMLTLMETHSYKAYYDVSLVVHHPVQTDVYGKQHMLNKFYSYSRGAGYLIKKHRFSKKYVFFQYFRPFGGIVVNLLKFRIYDAKKSYSILKGKMEGFTFRIPQEGLKK
ncbi:MAG: glycosyltransferase family 2 protein, partial [Treponema sp.]|nr:glycosyltransferase family 2 protein [Treponema sp.]